MVRVDEPDIMARILKYPKSDLILEETDIVSFIRNNKHIGTGTESTVDVWLSDNELLEILDSEGITDLNEALLYFSKLESIEIQELVLVEIREKTGDSDYRDIDMPWWSE